MQLDRPTHRISYESKSAPTVTEQLIDSELTRRRSKSPSGRRNLRLIARLAQGSTPPPTWIIRLVR